MGRVRRRRCKKLGQHLSNRRQLQSPVLYTRLNLGIESTPIIQNAMHTISATLNEPAREPVPWLAQWI